MKSFTVPTQVIPEHIVTRCEDCPDFENRGGSWGEYNSCQNGDGDIGDIHRRGGESIPDNCPRLKEPK